MAAACDGEDHRPPCDAGPCIRLHFCLFVYVTCMSYIYIYICIIYFFSEMKGLGNAPNASPYYSIGFWRKENIFPVVIDLFQEQQGNHKQMEVIRKNKVTGTYIVVWE